MITILMILYEDNNYALPDSPYGIKTMILKVHPLVGVAAVYLTAIAFFQL